MARPKSPPLNHKCEFNQLGIKEEIIVELEDEVITGKEPPICYGYITQILTDQKSKCFWKIPLFFLKLTFADWKVIMSHPENGRYFYEHFDIASADADLTTVVESVLYKYYFFKRKCDPIPEMIELNDKKKRSPIMGIN